MKYWYAVLDSIEDADWGFGSFDLNTARKMLNTIRKYSPLSLIAVIDGGYDSEGKATIDTLCVDYIYE